MHRRSALAFLGASFLVATRAAAASDGQRLIVVDRPGCPYCAAFRREIGPGYAAHPIGRRLPLTTVQLDGPWPGGLALDRAPTLTPTFLLINRGIEVGRIEGYPGADAFWPRVAALIAQAPQVRR